MSEIAECPKCGNLIDSDEVVCNQCGFDRSMAETHKPEKTIPTASAYSSASVANSASKQDLLEQTINGERNITIGKNNIVLIILTAVVVFLVVFIAASSKSTPWVLFFMLGMIAPFTITGYYVGRRTGNALEGAWFGAILGPLGIVIAFVLEDKDREQCVMCGEKIYTYAQVCPYCGDKKS